VIKARAGFLYSVSMVPFFAAARKTKWCDFHWRSHGCRHGWDCNHAHDISEYRGPADRYSQYYIDRDDAWRADDDGHPIDDAADRPADAADRPADAADRPADAAADPDSTDTLILIPAGQPTGLPLSPPYLEDDDPWVSLEGTDLAARISRGEFLACMGEQERETGWLIEADKLGCQRGADWLTEGLSEVERAGLIPDEAERADADDVIPALTRLCIKHALTRLCSSSASSSSVDADADAAVEEEELEEEELEEEELEEEQLDIVVFFLDLLG
jgi:hypothetical protein